MVSNYLSCSLVKDTRQLVAIEHATFSRNFIILEMQHSQVYLSAALIQKRIKTEYKTIVLYEKYEKIF